MERVKLLYEGDEEKKAQQEKIVKNALKRLELLMESKDKYKKRNLTLVLNSLSHLDIKGSKDPSSKHIVLTFSGFLS